MASAINQFLRSERQVQQQQRRALISPFEQIEREVVVVPEPVSNSLIVSATPRFFDEIKKLVEELDARPPMVMIQVLIAEVDLNNTDEFGVELGLQDSLLFDRSLLGNITTRPRTTFDADGNPASHEPGDRRGHEHAGLRLQQPAAGQQRQRDGATSGSVGAQGLSNFGVGPNEQRAGLRRPGAFGLQRERQRADPRLAGMPPPGSPQPAADHDARQPAGLHPGRPARAADHRQPRSTRRHQVNNITLENVGLILGVTPRISPDGLVVMEIDAEKSEVGPEAEGIPVSIAANGQVIRSPRIDTTTAQTTVSAMDGQTIVLGGLITKTQSRVPSQGAAAWATFRSWATCSATTAWPASGPNC